MYKKKKHVLEVEAIESYPGQLQSIVNGFATMLNFKSKLDELVNNITIVSDIKSLPINNGQINLCEIVKELISENLPEVYETNREDWSSAGQDFIENYIFDSIRSKLKIEGIETKYISYISWYK